MYLIWQENLLEVIIMFYANLYKYLDLSFDSLNYLAKDGTKAIHMSYDDRNMMNVLCKQVKYCKFDPTKTQVGFLDLVGKDRL